MAIRYCGPATTGSGSGADFNNLLALPDTTGFTRGDVYVCIEGIYGNRTLSTAASGSTTITIRAVDAAQDSGVAGYASSLHDGQVTLGQITLARPYFIIDGIRRTVTDSWTAPTGYGMRIGGVGADSLNGDDADFCQIRYADIGPTYELAPSAGTIAGYGQVLRFVYDQSDITISRCAIHNGTGLCQGAGADNLIFEYCDIGPGWGKQALRGGNGSISSGWTIRYNRFYQSSQTDPNDGTSGITGEVCIWDWTGTGSGHAIYGNVFYNDISGGRNVCILVGGDGAGWAGGGSDGTVAYNNTMAGMPEPGVFGMIDLNGSGTAARNNLFWDTAGTGVGASTVSNNVDAGADPFTNYAARNFTLSGATAAGAALSAPYNSDRLGNVRGNDGTWDVGAYEYVAGGGSAPNAPTNLRLQ